MSGIAGIYHLDQQPIEHASLQGMIETIAHRGPDDAGIWCDGHIGLGHCMLWTTPESLSEKLPFATRTGDLVITADARIDNRDELIAALNLECYDSEKLTDSQLILFAYRRWQVRCPEYLLGDFAFAIWDKGRQTLFCARDHLGVKPFYYCKVDSTFIFASEVKALLSLPHVPRRLNEVRIAEYLTSMMENKTATSYQGIFRLPPAQSLCIKPNKDIEGRSYWSLDPNYELQLQSDREYADAFRKIFTEAVRCRLRSAFPVGSHLSGGLDSSAVTCVARDVLAQAETDINKQHLHVFSNIFVDVPECDERPFINEVLKQGNLIPHYVQADRLGPLSEWQQFFQYYDEAFIGPSCSLPWGLNQAAKQAGVRICLDGFDGDTTVSHGAAYFQELARNGQWLTFVHEAQAVSKHFQTSPLSILKAYGTKELENLAKRSQWQRFFKIISLLSSYLNISRRSLFVKHGIKPVMPKFIRNLWQRIRRRPQSPTPQAAQEHLLNPKFAHRIGRNRLFEFLTASRSPPISARDEQWRTLTSGMFALTLELIDHSAAAFSVECRHPFMDKRLIEFCLALPPEQKLHQGWSRMIMRRALEGILPPKIQWRGGKTSMGPNFMHGLLKIDRQLLDEIALNKEESVRLFVNQDLLLAAYQRVVSMPPHKVKDEDLMLLWRVLTLALWLRHTNTNHHRLTNINVAKQFIHA